MTSSQVPHTNDSHDDQKLDLLIQHVTEGLDPERERELRKTMLAEPDSAREVEELERAAAEIDVLWTSTAEPLPTHLAASALQSFREFAPSAGSIRGTEPLKSEPSKRAASKHAGSGPAMFGQGFSNPAPSRYLAWSGWAAAVVACALLGVVMSRGGGQVRDRGTVAQSKSNRQKMTELASVDGTITVPWNEHHEDFRDVEGEVVWNSDRQEGYMLLRGLKSNEPSKEQYQLWIVDPERDSRHPVDGGVFDCPDTGEHVIAIHAKLDVATPTVFAITVEKPGGAVVSEDTALRVIGKPPLRESTEPRKR